MTNFRGLKNVLMVTVLEGNGTVEDPHREVKYIYEGEQLIGKIDSVK